MEQNSYKKKLQERTFEPSKDSWKVLEERLTAFENKKNVKKRYFFKYAATILVLISVGLYFNQKKDKNEVIIVEEPVIQLNELKKDLLKLAPEEVLVEVSKEVKIIQPKIKTIIVKPTKLANIQKKGNYYLKNKQVIVDNQISNLKIDNIETKTIQEFVVLAQAIERKNGEVTDLEIELLLKQAQKSLNDERKIFKKKGFNGSDLLAEIEYDLDKDFKAKLFEAIVNTLKDPKKVFVNRDN